MSKVALVLSSGTARGFAHVGVLKALEEANVKIDLIVGTSIGAIIGGAYAIGKTVEELSQIASNLKKRHVIDFSLRFKKHKGLIKGKKIDKILSDIFGDKTFKDCKIPFACVSNELVLGETVTFTEGLLTRGIRASCSIPCLIAPLIEEDRVYVDGGVTNRLALSQAKELGADKIIAVDVVGEIEKPNLKGPFSVIFRSMDCIDNQVSKQKLILHSPDVYICPNLSGIAQAQVERFKEIYQMGYIATKEKISEIEKIIKGE